MRTDETRNLADAPEASEHNHVDEPAKSLFKPPNSWIRCSMPFMSLFTSFNGVCSGQIVFYCRMRMAWSASAIGKVRWKLWRTTRKHVR